MTNRHPFSRRTLLRGTLAGAAAIALPIPVLDIMLDGNGVAFADGTPRFARFGTWFWGCGMNPARWVPPTQGSDYALSTELAALAPVRQHVSVLSGFNVPLDGRANHPHISGAIGTLTGATPQLETDLPGPTLDTLVAAEIGATTRFRSLEVSASGDRQDTYSRLSESAVNPSEISPVELYQRLFGPEFHDPADGVFVADPEVLLRQSVLSIVKEDRARLDKQLGTHDRRRMEEFYTALRQLENQLVTLSSEPPDLAACARPEAPVGESIGTEVEQARQTHDALTELVVMALACDQTRVFNVVYSAGLSDLRKAGSNISHHQLTHDEPVDAELGYQPQVTELAATAMDAWAGFVARLASVEEGDGTLLDSCLVMAHSDTAFAKIHDITGLPVMLAGRAAGAVQAGVHVAGGGEPVSRVGLTVLQAMGVPVERWGSDSLQTNQPISDVLV